jgi:superfamily I DNA/RNA helicase
MPVRSSPIPREWWDETLPKALERATEALPDYRFHAVIVDEGQDFEPNWLVSLQPVLVSPDDDVLWVFHDPGQALYRDDRVSELGLQRIDLYENHRNPQPVAELADRFYHGSEELMGYREGGLTPANHRGVAWKADAGGPTG